MFDWILNIIEVGGYLGIFALMILENIFPPIPSEVIIPLAGYAAADGALNIVLVILVAALGTMVGALFWYSLGRVFGLSRLKRASRTFGRWLTLSERDIDAAAEWFNAHGHKAVFFGRLLPVVRTLISLPAGLARMPLLRFLAYSFLGNVFWITMLALFGYFLQSQYERIGVYLNPVSDIVVVLIIGIYLYRVVTFKNQK